MITMKYCSRCCFENPPQEKYCKVCGGEVFTEDDPNKVLKSIAVYCGKATNYLKDRDAIRNWPKDVK